MIYEITSSYTWTSNDQEKRISFELARPELTGLAIYKVDGLGPLAATINTSGKVGDGERYNSTFVPKRPITIYFKPLDIVGELFKNQPSTGDYVEENRHRIYEMFPYKKEIRLEIRTATRHCYIYGYVEHIEADIFSNAETVAVSLICPDPYFYSIEDNTINYSLIESSFTIPVNTNGVPYHTEDPKSWTIPMVSGDVPKVPLSVSRVDSIKEFQYVGDVPSGVYIEIFISSNPVSIFIKNNRGENNEYLEINCNKINEFLYDIGEPDLKYGDIIIVNSLDRYFYISLNRGNISYNILSCINFNEINGRIAFPKIYPGFNEFKIELTNSAGSSTALFYPVLYGGI